MQDSKKLSGFSPTSVPGIPGTTPFLKSKNNAIIEIINIPAIIKIVICPLRFLSEIIFPSPLEVI